MYIINNDQGDQPATITEVENLLNKIIIPLTLVGYVVIITNSAPRWLLITSYLTHVREITVLKLISK